MREALGVDRWSVLGQSFGGFCALTYLSFAPEGLREAFFTGGVPPVGRPVDEVYAATYATQLRAQPPLLRALPAATATACGRCTDRCDAGEMRAAERRRDDRRAGSASSATGSA